MAEILKVQAGAPATGRAAGEEFKLPHGSLWPPVAALGVGVLYFAVLTVARGYALGWGLFGLAALVILVAALGIVREDARWWQGRVSTGARNGWWGIVFFLGGEVMLFAALFATFFNHRAFALESADLGSLWDEGQRLVGTGETLLTTGINTVILLLSGVTVHWAHVGIRRGNTRRLKLGLALTILLGAVFIAGQVREYLALAAEGLVVQHSTFGSTFYALTGTHGAHVLGGLIVLGFVLARALRGQFDQQRHVAVEVTAIYWHFVDVVWVVLFAVVYLGIV